MAKAKTVKEDVFDAENDQAVHVLLVPEWSLSLVLKERWVWKYLYSGRKGKGEWGLESQLCYLQQWEPGMCGFPHKFIKLVSQRHQ